MFRDSDCVAAFDAQRIREFFRAAADDLVGLARAFGGAIEQRQIVDAMQCFQSQRWIVVVQRAIEKERWLLQAFHRVGAKLTPGGRRGDLFELAFGQRFEFGDAAGEGGAAGQIGAELL